MLPHRRRASRPRQRERRDPEWRSSFRVFILLRSGSASHLIRLCEEFHKVEKLAGIMSTQGFRRKPLSARRFPDSRSMVRITSIAIARRNRNLPPSGAARNTSDRTCASHAPRFASCKKCDRLERALASLKTAHTARCVGGSAIFRGGASSRVASPAARCISYSAMSTACARFSEACRLSEL